MTIKIRDFSFQLKCAKSQIKQELKLHLIIILKKKIGLNYYPLLLFCKAPLGFLKGAIQI